MAWVENIFIFRCSYSYENWGMYNRPLLEYDLPFITCLSAAAKGIKVKSSNIKQPIDLYYYINTIYQLSNFLAMFFLN